MTCKRLNPLQQRLATFSVAGFKATLACFDWNTTTGFQRWGQLTILRRYDELYLYLAHGAIAAMYVSTAIYEAVEPM